MGQINGDVAGATKHGLGVVATTHCWDIFVVNIVVGLHHGTKWGNGSKWSNSIVKIGLLPQSGSSNPYTPQLLCSATPPGSLTGSYTFVFLGIMAAFSMSLADIARADFEATGGMAQLRVTIGLAPAARALADDVGMDRQRIDQGVTV